ncbi:MAG: tetratricopeptide repeat protein [Cyanobacteria bacterium P01_C01_bin.70]
MNSVISTATVRVIGSWCLCLCLLWGAAPPAIAANPVSNFSQDDIQEIATLREKAFITSREGDYVAAEELWTQLLEYLPEEPAIWSNRGIVKASQFHLDEAIADYTQAILLAPEEADAYLNRGAAYEMQRDWAAAIADYNRVLDIDPEEAGALNNRGNAEAGQGNWTAAIADYERAADLDRNFALARVNYGLALFQTEQTERSLKVLRGIVRKYPNFPDARAALTAELWAQNQRGEAESQWVAVEGLDKRYQDIDWVRTVRRWPPKVADALEQFLLLEG